MPVNRLAFLQAHVYNKKSAQLDATAALSPAKNSRNKVTGVYGPRGLFSFQPESPKSLLKFWRGTLGPLLPQSRGRPLPPRGESQARHTTIACALPRGISVIFPAGQTQGRLGFSIGEVRAWGGEAPGLRPVCRTAKARAGRARRRQAPAWLVENIRRKRVDVAGERPRAALRDALGMIGT